MSYITSAGKRTHVDVTLYLAILIFAEWEMMYMCGVQRANAHQAVNKDSFGHTLKALQLSSQWLSATTYRY
jgi:hypothetical protein